MAKQKLIILSGSPCVGKTTVGNALFDACENSAYFDGDWAWCVNPFSLADPRLRCGDKTMSFALSNYLGCGFAYVIFASVVTGDAQIRQNILRDITATDYTLIPITLTCSEETLKARHKKRGDPGECSFFWLQQPPVEGDHIICTDGKTPDQIVQEIMVLIESMD